MGLGQNRSDSDLMSILISSPIVTIFVFAFVLSIAATVSAPARTPATAPLMDTGAAFSLPASGVVVAFSLLVSHIAFPKH
ncbi:putative L-type lectin-domain containing receptor kinase S.5 [Hibiscus syriacus]|uniref:L-type lectin-domain containing receptor kinase S.5 n=1 Tax=Hibiscus syriacus TaxID=106335 RepID=A0A6A2ZDA6_HIBSY|nr:putative L-type lectin-domain containing receptor kinase S.5 [Hibiscus syriacus]